MRCSDTKQKKHAIAIACSILLVRPPCHIPNLREASPGPDLPEGFKRVTSLENSSQVGIEEFFDDPKLATHIPGVVGTPFAMRG